MLFNSSSFSRESVFFVKYIAWVNKSDDEYPGTISLIWVKKTTLIVKAIRIIEYKDNTKKTLNLFVEKENLSSKVSSLETTTL